MSFTFGMHELQCNDCHRVVAFSNRMYYSGKAGSKIRILCVDCYFMQIKGTNQK